MIPRLHRFNNVGMNEVEEYKKEVYENENYGIYHGQCITCGWQCMKQRWHSQAALVHKYLAMYILIHI